MTQGREGFTRLTDPECIWLLTRYRHGPAAVVLSNGLRVPVTYEIVEGTVTFTPHSEAFATGTNDRVVRFEIERYDDPTACLCRITVKGRATIFGAPPPDHASRTSAWMCRWFLEPQQIAGSRGPVVPTSRHGPNDGATRSRPVALERGASSCGRRAGG